MVEPAAASISVDAMHRALCTGGTCTFAVHYTCRMFDDFNDYGSHCDSDEFGDSCDYT